jgi:hypothetical protein
MSIHQRTKSLSVTGNQLSDTFFQLKVLNGNELTDAKFPAFAEKIGEFGYQRVLIFFKSISASSAIRRVRIVMWTRGRIKKWKI